MFVLGMAGFFNDFVMPAAWASTMDKGGRYAGTVSGAMNMVGGIAGAFSSLIVGYILRGDGQRLDGALYVSASHLPGRRGLLAVPRPAHADRTGRAGGGEGGVKTRGVAGARNLAIVATCGYTGPMEAGIRELKDNLSRYIRRIEAGERIAVTAHGRVVAELGAPVHIEGRSQKPLR